MPDPKRDRPDPGIPGDYRDYLLRQGRWEPGYDAAQARLAAAAEAAAALEESQRPKAKPRWRRPVDAHPWIFSGCLAMVSLVLLAALGSLLAEVDSTGAPAPTPTPAPPPPETFVPMPVGSIASYLFFYGCLGLFAAVVILLAAIVSLLERIGPWRLKQVPGVDPLERFRRPAYLRENGPRWRDWRKSAR